MLGKLIGFTAIQILVGVKPRTMNINVDHCFTTIQILVGVKPQIIILHICMVLASDIRHCSIKTKCCYLIPSILGHKIALTSNDV